MSVNFLNLDFSIFNAVSDQFSASKWFIYEKNGHPQKLMTLTKTILWSLSRQTNFLQNLFNHIRLILWHFWYF